MQDDIKKKCRTLTRNDPEANIIPNEVIPEGTQENARHRQADPNDTQASVTVVAGEACCYGTCVRQLCCYRGESCCLGGQMSAMDFKNS